MTVEEIGKWMPPGQRELFVIWAEELEKRILMLESGGAKGPSSVSEVLVEKSATLAAGLLGAQKPQIIPLAPFGKLGHG